MLPRLSSYDAIRSAFTWSIPEHFNMGVDICDRWADDPARLALIHERNDGVIERFTFAQLKRLSNQVANLFTSRGLRAGDRRVAIAVSAQPHKPAGVPLGHLMLGNQLPDGVPLDLWG